ncbi:hypothetical protein EMCRGX_G032243 [Ephydatia muelleri]|eukprot:Em0019g615a
MFAGCYLAGSIPLVFTLSEALLRRVTTLSAGLLIGTALIVIIPEGVESLFSDTTLHRDHHHNAAAPAQLSAGPDSNAAPGEGYGEDGLNTIMGLALTCGFLFMLLIDQCGEPHTHTPDAECGGKHQRKKLTATIGLVVHSAADGMALGAAAGLKKLDVEMVIFLAIMLHKAPESFGFTTFLLHEGYDRNIARKHLLIFALSAPIAAFIAYFGLSQVLHHIQFPVTGVAMLLSGGTFLYVSTVHVLSEVMHSHEASGSRLQRSELLLLVAGAILPCVFNVLHSH